MSFHIYTSSFLVFIGLVTLIDSTLVVDPSSLNLPTVTLGSLDKITSPSVVTAAAVAGVGALAVAGSLIATDIIDLHRRKRMAEACLPVNNPDIFFSLAASSDKLGCGMRLICELEKTTDEKLSNEEKLILGLFGRSPKPVNPDELATAKSGFQYAAFVGANAEDISECGDVFNQCPFSRDVMMKAFREANNM